ncbi:unnamed protein product [Vitrella brassicaformis CCMP3155]|uniref:Uncharacterized protein n=1 Tax=Vitrella brassicaformis (strain CCMP3155) TaxID=1169540 RepID=A0A0G4FWB2_VITBC|nr:unnamed protein product [Vitrella brassicaformis CCMP3155]|eukprot:CEM19485.1 unnamed protein product [Vitrella brassicaformis CCMP3155]
MPKKVKKLVVDHGVPFADSIHLLEGLGRDREVEMLVMYGVDLRLLVDHQDAAARLPTIGKVELNLTVPEGVEDAGSHIRWGLSAICQSLRGLQQLDATWPAAADVGDHIAGGTRLGSDFTVTGETSRWLGNSLTAKRGR